MVGHIDSKPNIQLTDVHVIDISSVHVNILLVYFKFLGGKYLSIAQINYMKVN